MLPGNFLPGPEVLGEVLDKQVWVNKGKMKVLAD